MSIKEFIKIVRLLGLRQAVKIKRHHELGLAYVRGYTATSCWWALLNCGFLGDLQAHGYLNIDQYINNRNHNNNKHVKSDNGNRNSPQNGNGNSNKRQSKINRAVFNAIIEYLNGVGLLEIFGQSVRLSKTGQVLLAEPRGLYELLWSYEPCFCNLSALLAGEKIYGRDVARDVSFVGIGSGRLYEQLPYPIMRSMILGHNCQMVIDLGCGDMALDAGLCRLNEQIHCHGIDFSDEMINYNKQQLQKNNYNGRLTVQKGDIFALGKLSLPDEYPPIDCITACDTFHEYLDDKQKIITLLQYLQQRFPNALFVIGEFCLQDAKWLRKHPTASLEHHLFNQLSNQKTGSVEQWQEIFHCAGLKIIDQQIFNIIGHGYFALKGN